jgi:hypothetical protein
LFQALVKSNNANGVKMLLKSRQLMMLVLSLSLFLSCCSSDDVKVTATRKEPSSSTASPVERITNDEGWIARHQKEDRLWASRTGLTPEQVRELRLMADVPDDEAVYIDNLDTKTIQARNQVLMVTVGGNGHCLELVIFNREGDNFQRIWSVAETPSGGGLCRESPIDPEAYATSDGRLLVKIPIFDWSKGATAGADIYTYSWNGKDYEFAGKSISTN